MKASHILLAAAAALQFLLPATTQAQTQDELMAKAMAANVVGKEHDILKQLEGDWIEEFWYQMAPDQAPLKVDGKAEIETILGGRFIELEGESWGGGMTSERLTLVGHDNRKGVYTIAGYDTHGTYAIHAEGKYDPTTKSIRFEGVEADPLMPHAMKFEIIWRFPDANTIETEIWFLTGMNGEPTKNKIVWSVSKRVVEKKGKKQDKED